MSKHPNPWSSKNGKWLCNCQRCKADRSAWPETTRIYKPKKGKEVIF